MNLANANLLDETVANSASLKNQRLNNTAKTASNPNPNPIPNQTLKKVDLENDEVHDDEVNENENESFQRLQNDFHNNIEEKEKTDDKILGMPKMVAIGLGVALLATAAYFGYKYYKKNKTKSLTGTGSSSIIDSAPKI